MKKILSLLLLTPLTLSACGNANSDTEDNRQEIPGLEVEEGFTDEFGDWNVYGLDQYENLNNGDLITMQLRLESASLGSAWGYETRWSDMFGNQSIDMAEEIFGSKINRLVFSFPTEVMEDLVIGGVYFIELQKNIFPPNGRPQFGLEGIGPWGENTDTEGKICSVNEMEECDELTNNEYGKYSSITNLREGGKHTVQAKWLVNPSGSSDYYGIGEKENGSFAYTDTFGGYDITTLEDNKMYEFEISDAQWYSDAHGTGDFYGYINIESAIEIDEEDEEAPVAPEHDFGFENSLFSDLTSGVSVDNVVVMFSYYSANDNGLNGGAEFVDAANTDFVEYFTSNVYDTISVDTAKNNQNLQTGVWYRLTNVVLSGSGIKEQLSFDNNPAIIADYNPS